MILTWQRLVKPRKLDVVEESDDGRMARIIAEPFERGVATTVGVALRRFLLSAIPGTAIVAVKFEGIHHEFSSISGVLEDVSEIILNIKQVILIKEGPEDRALSLTASGVGDVTAGMIETGPEVKVLNPDLKLATITDERASLKIEMIARNGSGYAPAEESSDFSRAVDVIPVDAAYSPVINVSYKVEKTRVEQSTDYDRLVMTITTNGATTPRDAAALAAKALKDHMQIFINFDEEIEAPTQKINAAKLAVAKNLLRSVEELELSVRSYNCLKNAEIKTLMELVARTEADMLKTRNFGRKSLNEIKEILEDLNLHLGMDVDQYKEELAMLERGASGALV